MEAAFLSYLLGSTTIAILVIYVILFKPENIERIAGWIWKTLSNIAIFFKFAHKNAVKFELQVFLNDYLHQISKEVPQIGNFKVEVEFVENTISKQSFLTENKVILRLRKDDPFEVNFVHGAYLFVSTSLLYRVKRYISKSQREALDLFVTTRIIQKEKPLIVSQFLDDYLHPQLNDPKSKKSNYYNQFAHIDESGLFYPVLLEELDVLGGKVFGKRNDDKIITEVDGLVDFLEEVSERTVGDDQTDLDFKREYCRFAIMIIGKRFKLEDSTKPYINFIREKLHVSGIETVYLLGRVENKNYVNQICDAVGDIYWQGNSRETKTILRFSNGLSENANQYIVTLKMVGASIYQLG